MIDNKPEFLVNISKKLHEILPTRYLPRTVTNTGIALLVAVGISGCGDTQVPTCTGYEYMSQVKTEVAAAHFHMGGKLLDPRFRDSKYIQHELIEAHDRAACPGHDTFMKRYGRIFSYKQIWPQLQAKDYEGSMDTESVMDEAVQYGIIRP